MPYAPTVNDRSGEILAGYQTNAAEIKAAGQQALADGIARGATSAIGGALGAMTDTNTAGMITDGKGRAVPGLGESIEKANQNKMTSDYLDSMANFFNQSTGPDGQPMMDDETLAKFSKASLGAKQGMIAPRQAAYEQMLQNSYIEKQMASYMQRAGYAAQVPQNQQPVSNAGISNAQSGAANPQPNPVGGINFNYVK